VNGALDRPDSGAICDSRVRGTSGRRSRCGLDARLDQLADEKAVRREIDDFNARVISARYEPPAGPPLITMPRDPDTTVAEWAARRPPREASRSGSHG